MRVRRWAIAAALAGTVAGAAGVVTPHGAWAAGTRAGMRPPGPPPITVTMLLGPEGQPLSEVTDINDQGQVIGAAAPPGEPSLDDMAVLWERGEATYIGPSSGARPDHVHAADINDRGRVVGNVVEHVFDPSEPGSAPSSPSRAFSWRDGRWRLLGPPALLDQAFAVNDRGQVAGNRKVSEVGEDPGNPSGWEAVVWEDGRVAVAPISLAISELPSISEINDRGQVLIGLVDIFPQRYSVALWEVGGSVTRLPTLGGPDLTGMDLDQRGRIVGYGPTASGDTHAFLWEDGEMTDLGTLPGDTSSYALAVNDRGQVVGSSGSTPPGQRAVLWEDGEITDLGTLGGSHSRAIDINNRGQVVGTSETAGGDTHAFLWEDGEMTDLGALTDFGRSFVVAINDRGEVLGYVHHSVQDQRPVLWAPARRR